MTRFVSHKDNPLTIGCPGSALMMDSIVGKLSGLAGSRGQLTVFRKGGKTRTVLLKPKAWQQLLSIKGEAQAVDPKEKRPE
jgi:hypothetical protein